MNESTFESRVNNLKIITRANNQNEHGPTAFLEISKQVT